MFRAPFLKTLTALSVCCPLIFLSGCGNDDSQKIEKAALHFKSANAYSNQGQYRAAISEYQIALDTAPTTEHAVALAKVYLELNQNPAAIKLLQPLNEKYPKQTALALAESYLQRGKYRTALGHLSEGKALNNIPEDQNRGLMLAQAQIGLNQLSEAEQTLKQYHNLFGKNADSELLQLALATASSDTESAQKSITALKETYTDSAKANQTLGQIALKANKLQEAERYFTTTLSLLPKTDIMTPAKLQALTLLSETLTKRGRFTEALIYSQLIAEAHPNYENTQKSLNEAINEISLGNLDRAEELLTELANSYPSSDQINALLGVVNLQQGDINEAGVLFENSVDPETASFNLIKAATQAQLQLAKPQQAVQLLEEALKSDPDNIQLLTLFGLSSSQVPGLEKQSELALQKAVAMQPEKPRIYLALAQLYSRQGKQQLALSQLKLATEKGLDDPAITSSYVQALIQTKQLETAKSFLKELNQNQPSNATGWQLSAAIAQSEGDLTSANQHLDKALSINPKDSKALIAKGRLAQQQGNLSQAQKHYQQALTISAEEPAAITALLATSIKVGNLNQISQQIDKLASKGNQAAIASLGQLSLSKQDWADAKKRAQQLLQLNINLSAFSKTTGANIQRALAKQEIEAKNYSKAITELETAMKFSPANNQLLADLAQAQLLNGQNETALATLAQLRQRQGGQAPADQIEALMIEPNDPAKAIQLLRDSFAKNQDQAIIALQYKLERKHQTNTAANTLNLWHESYPNDLRAILALAMQAQQQNQQQDAIKWYEKLLALNPTQVIALNNLAWLYGETSQYSKAIVTGEKAAQLAPNSPEILDTLGWIYHQAGDKRALATLTKAAELAPDNKGISEHLKAAKNKP